MSKEQSLPPDVFHKLHSLNKISHAPPHPRFIIESESDRALSAAACLAPSDGTDASAERAQPARSSSRACPRVSPRAMR